MPDCLMPDARCHMPHVDHNIFVSQEEYYSSGWSTKYTTALCRRNGLQTADCVLYCTAFSLYCTDNTLYCIVYCGQNSSQEPMSDVAILVGNTILGVWLSYFLLYSLCSCTVSLRVISTTRVVSVLYTATVRHRRRGPTTYGAGRIALVVLDVSLLCGTCRTAECRTCREVSSFEPSCRPHKSPNKSPRAHNKTACVPRTRKDPFLDSHTVCTVFPHTTT